MNKIDLEKKKQQLVNEFNQNQQVLLQLNAKQQQIIGQLELIKELEENKKQHEMGNNNT